MDGDPDHGLRLSALARARELAMSYGDIVPLSEIRRGFVHDGQRVSFGSFQKGIHRAKQQRGPAALTLVTAPHKPGTERPYDDLVDLDTRSIIYHYRAGPPSLPDNRALRAACEIQAPIIYFLGIAPGQYQVIAPAFVVGDDPAARMVQIEIGLPHVDTRGEGLRSSTDARSYAMSMVRRRYHQARFRRDVLAAYRTRCAVCSLREPQLIEAAHIVGDAQEAGIAAVVNGIALCAIHHVAYDRNLMGIDPAGVVHISERLLREIDGPMLSQGLQGFHGAAILRPRRTEHQPDPELLETRFSEFLAHAA